MTEISLRVATYNIRKAMGTDRRRDPGRVLRVIAALDADVVLLQEADLRMPPRPPALDRAAVTAVTGLIAVPFGHGRDSLGWHGNAVLLRPDLEVETTSHHDLPGLEPRGHVEVVIRKGAARFRVMGLHLGLLRASRRIQLTALNAQLAKGPALPTLIAGDFNERSLSVGLGRLARGFRILSGGPTYHSRWPVFPLDRIAVTPQFQADTIRAHRSAEAALASDHLPLVAELRLQSIPGTT